MIQEFARTDFKVGHNSPRPGISRAENKSSDSRMDDRPGAHRAGLDCRIHRRPGKPVIPNVAGGIANSHHFRVGSGIRSRDHTVLSASLYLTVNHDDRADRDFTGCSSRGCFTHGQTHKLLIAFHTLIKDKLEPCSNLPNPCLHLTGCYSLQPTIIIKARTRSCPTSSLAPIEPA